MYFIISVALMLLVITSLIFYIYVQEKLWPMFLKSKHTIKFRRRLSAAIYLLMIEIRNDVYGHLETLCEADGDEPFEPYMDSPLRTCPPTEFILTPPKEQVQPDSNNNGQVEVPPRRRGRRRIVFPPPIPEDIPRMPVPQPANNLNIPNPVVVVNMPPPRRVFPQNLRVLALQQQANHEQENERNRLGPEWQQFRQAAELLSPPPQQNVNNNGNNERVFQFD